MTIRVYALTNLCLMPKSITIGSTNMEGVMFTCVVPWRLLIASSAANTVKVYDSAPACSRSKGTAVVMFPWK